MTTCSLVDVLDVMTWERAAGLEPKRTTLFVATSVRQRTTTLFVVAVCK